MIHHFDKSKASKVLEISKVLSVVLIERLAQESIRGRTEDAKNIFLIDGNGSVIWQVSSDFDSDGGPYTNIFYSDGRLQGYRWDGGIYDIDLESGVAVPNLFLR
ncbi:hypothetical protein [Pseudomonas sp. NPDC089734]|uniref:hypothetical protein n=1 Tax=Pseudomonas sp. NPDC089734 TaxID=3364469 RepID=UPI00380BA1D7